MTEMLTPPTDRLHKFLAIAGIALLIVGITFPLDKYDQAVRFFIEAKAQIREVSKRQQQLSNRLSEGSIPADEVERVQRDIEASMAAAEKAGELAEHAAALRTIWFWIGVFCILSGLSLATIGFSVWWKQPPEIR